MLSVNASWFNLSNLPQSQHFTISLHDRASVAKLSTRLFLDRGEMFLVVTIPQTEIVAVLGCFAGRFQNKDRHTLIVDQIQAFNPTPGALFWWWPQLLIETLIMSVDRSRVWRLQVVPARLNGWWSDMEEVMLYVDPIVEAGSVARCESVKSMMGMYYDVFPTRFCGFEPAPKAEIVKYEGLSITKLLKLADPPFHTKVLE